ncbi:glycine/betaine ABC transporter [Rhodothalassium salexigens]|uniref:ABC transporter permease n=1 Tax=Rhodothalassium salexigens TaxID=1086 RepID=UPI0019120A16|nr:proline/glycine betaine ABC transporter permease [Rhodothalassium salexigens]MBK5911983.1 glycine/betaine ABC transporter [Rhodothalassium salexigens]MBK5922147.1 glycine/betaine ABC transporter [Rhodothalassium salexigens]
MAIEVPFGAWMAWLVDACLRHLGGLFDAITWAVGGVIGALETVLLTVPAWAGVPVLVFLSAWRVGLRFAVGAAVGLALIPAMGLWAETMVTLALILGAATFSLVAGLPLGVLSAKSQLAQALIRPVLDLMQTLPPFVYLIPAAMFFGLGKVPGAIATIIFSMPPAVRLTDLGIRGVDATLVEAARAFGCTPGQLLVKVQLPLALPSIMAGLNQTIMLALSMVVIASMIGAGGLGNEVLAGIQRLDIGRGFEGGAAVVILAIVLDRLSQSVGRRRTPRTLLARALAALVERPAAAGATTDRQETAA